MVFGHWTIPAARVVAMAAYRPGKAMPFPGQNCQGGEKKNEEPVQGSRFKSAAQHWAHETWPNAILAIDLPH